MKKVLVTGGLGYIGSHTVVALQAEGYELVVVDNLSNSTIAVKARIEELSQRSFRFYEQDICDLSSLRTLFAAEQPQAVIHFAGYKAVGESVQKPLAYYDNNLNGTINLLKCLSEFGCKELIFSSSATVYASDNPLPFNENGRLESTNPYGWTKLMSEQILRDFAQAHPATAIMLLRYFNPVGAHPSALLGENPVGTPNNLMPYIMQVAAGKLAELGIFGHDYPTPDGTGVRDYIHVQDLATGHVAALAYAAQHPGVLALNLGTGKGSSVLDLVNCFEAVNGVTIPRRFLPRRAGDNAATYADPSLAFALLKWRAQLSLADMCRDSWQWQLQLQATAVE